MMRQLIFTFVFLIFAPVVYGCSTAALPVRDDPDAQPLLSSRPLYRKEAFKATNYVFIGEVVEIIKAAESEIPDNFSGAEGIRVKVTEYVSAPQMAVYYEVFPLTLMAVHQAGADEFTKKFPDRFAVQSHRL
ncbi:MAG TPA: hypothetical protein VIL74_03225 [Pyrinomonadaceae bacterium]|jgi:hypothetical protein